MNRSSSEPFIRIRQAVAAHPAYRFSQPVCWDIAPGEPWVVIGPNGAGKSLLTGILTRRVALKSGSVTIDDPRGAEAIRTIAFRDIHPPAESREMYYQQRWNTTETDVSPLVAEWFPAWNFQQDDPFDIAALVSRRAMSLSSGELRKLLVARALQEKPALLAIDNPFIGLDASSREVLDGMLERLCRENILQCVLTVCDPKDIPAWVRKVLPVAGRTVFPPMEREAFMNDKVLQQRLFGSSVVAEESFAGLLPVDTGASPADYRLAVQMKGVNVVYGGHVVLENFDWTVRRGEKWAVVGANGSGKSTLFSLVCADNPQAYANDIVLFDRKRGTGESIWDIKRRIGYVSPEMHTYYQEPIECVRVVASGFFDSIGLFRRCSEQQMAIARAWLRVFGAEDLSERLFTQASYGEQRLVLLARALVKDPDMLILDEPFHGLDAGRKRLAKAVIEYLADRGGKTLLFVSHYRDEVPDCVNHVLQLGSPAR